LTLLIIFDSASILKTWIVLCRLQANQKEPLKKKPLLSREADDKKPNGTERDDRGKGNQGGKGSM